MILGFSLDACKTYKTKSPVVQESSVSEDSVKYIYEGILPAADAAGIRYVDDFILKIAETVTFVSQNILFRNKGKKDTIFTTAGRRYAHEETRK